MYYTNYEVLYNHGWRDGFPWKILRRRCFHIYHVVRPTSMVHNDLSFVDFVCDQDGESIVLIVPRSSCMKGPDTLNWEKHDSWSVVSHWAAAMRPLHNLCFHISCACTTSSVMMIQSLHHTSGKLGPTHVSCSIPWLEGQDG